MSEERGAGRSERAREGAGMDVRCAGRAGGGGRERASRTDRRRRGVDAAEDSRHAIRACVSPAHVALEGDADLITTSLDERVEGGGGDGADAHCRSFPELERLVALLAHPWRRDVVMIDVHRDEHIGSVRRRKHA
jgi:hypothetical protein